MDTILVIIDYLNNYYYGHRKFFLLALFCLAYLFFFEKKLRNKLVIPLIICYGVILNPILYDKVFSLIVYRRLFWIFSDVLLVMITIVSLIKKLKEDIYRYFSFALVILIIMNVGNYQYSKSDRFSETKHLEKLPDNVVEVCEYILSQDIEATCIMDEWVSNYVRQYSADIKLLYGRNATGYISDISDEEKEIFDAIKDENFDVVLSYAKNNGYNFVVLENYEIIYRALLNQYGYYEAFTLGEYRVYQKGEYGPTVDGWELMNHDDLSGNMCIFYTLYNFKNDHLIVIDGGYKENASQVRKEIKRRGNVVDAWIVTHYHPDHVGAFNEIYNDPQGITIKNVYAPEMDYDYYLEIATKDDYPETFKEFLDITNNKTNINYVHDGKQIFIDNLTIDIISSGNDVIKSFSDYYSNDSGIVFKVSGQEDTILFTSDVESEQMGKYLIRYYKNELPAKYLQVNHHGNNQFPLEFYDIVNPEIVIFDTPNWLFAEKENARDLRKYFVDKKVKVYDFRSIPNRFIFK